MQIADNQRAAFYGDTLFETLRVFGGKLLFMPQHWARLVKGLSVMGYELPDHWSAAFFEHEIQQHLRHQGTSDKPLNARVRLSVWRSPGGLYLPTDNTPQFYISSQILETDNFQWSAEGLNIGFAESVRLPVDGLSGLKAPNAPRYVAAAIEAHQRGWQDALLLNSEGRVCEATSSNVFWIKDGQVFTPPLADGPVTGILRALFLNLTFDDLPKVKEKSADKMSILLADEVFLTNAIRGIIPVASCEGKAFRADRSVRYFQALAQHVEALLGLQQ
jgi:branched-chain amino acid aminotransferase